MIMMKVNYYNCPICKKKYKTLSGWGEHMNSIHPESIPKGYSISRYFYYIKTGKNAGKCRTCGKPTPWNEQSMKYDQYCTNPECKKAYAKIAKQRMIDTYGKVHLLNDPNHQKKMLENRKISGKYKFSDGTQFGYVGNYEKNFLEMMDKLMQWHSNDLMSPSPHTYYYDYKNSKDKDNEGRKFYIPDFYIPSLNLEIEIKQQTSTNKAYNDINKVKEKLKDDIMNKNPKVNYLKINDNNFAPFFQFLMEAKEQIPTVKEDNTGQLMVTQESNLSIEDQQEKYNKSLSEKNNQIVYFCKDITPGNILGIYRALGNELLGNVAVKIFSNNDCLDLWDPIIKRVKGTVIDFDIEQESSKLSNYDSLLILSENLDIISCMEKIITYIDNKFNEKIVIISALKNLSIEYSFDDKEKTSIDDIGILGSTCLSALINAYIDTIYNSTDYGRDEIIDWINKRIESKNENNKYTLVKLSSSINGSFNEISERWCVTQKNGINHTCVRLKDDPDIYRARSEILIIKNDEIFLNFKKDGEYSLPGGGWEPGEDPVNAAIREAQEEVRINVKNVKYGGERIWKYSGPTSWMEKTLDKKDWWNGCYCSMYIGEFDGSYNGYIQEIDKDNMINTGKFYKIGNIFDKLIDSHKEIIRKYYNGPYDKDNIILESSIHPDCECFGACGRLNYEKIGCSDCPYGITIGDSKIQQPLSYSDILIYCREFNYDAEEYYVSGQSALVLRGLKEYADKIVLFVSESLFKQIVKDNFKYYRSSSNIITIDVNDRVQCIYYKPFYDVETDYINGERVEKIKTLIKKFECFKFSDQESIALIRDYINNCELDEIDYNSLALEEANYSEENKYPVFIILQHSGTPVANVIKTFTKDEFSHACISFDSKLSKIYSFGNKKLNTLDPGFVIKKGPKDPFYKKRKTYYSVYVMYVNKSSYNKMKEKLNFFIDNKDSLKYDIINLFSCWIGRPSEKSEKYFCSKFVMTIISAGQSIEKVPSLYRPQELSELDDITLVNHGTDFYQYNYKLTDLNIDKIKENKFSEIVIENELLPAIRPLEKTDKFEIVTEGFFDLFKKKEPITSWKNYLFKGKGFFGAFEYMYAGVKINNGKIEIRGINYLLLRNRIKMHYEDKSIYNIFIPKYNALSYKRFEKKRIQRADIKIDYLYTEEFFALELAILFTDLGNRFNDTGYKVMANYIYEYSWLSKADKDTEITPLLNTKNLNNLRLELNDYQEDFIKKYPKLKAQLNLNGYILAFEQGLGKTLTAIGLAECLEVDHVYIVCPNSLKENWALEIQKYYEKYDDDDEWRSEVFICSDKSIYFNEHTTKFMIINNESIQKMYPYVMSGKNLLIVDESHNFRNLDSKRVQQLIELRDKLKCKDTLIMSGTPIKATPSEIVPALLMIDPTFTIDAAKIFTKAFKLHSALGTSLVQTRFGKVIYRKEKEVLKNELPNKYINPLFVSINDKNKYTLDSVSMIVMNRFSEIYDSGYVKFQSYRDPFFEISKKYTPKEMDNRRFVNVITQIVKKDKSSVHEIDLMYVEEYMKKVKEKMSNKKDKDHYDFLIKNYVKYRAHCLGLAYGEILPSYRRDMYISMYEENKDKFISMIQNNTKKTLIFTQFKGVANHIYHSLTDDGIGSAMITGDVKNRLEILKEFKENPSILVLVATSQTIGTGVTLTEASQMFFFGPPWRDSDFEQCSDRIHRIGQTDDCYIYTVSLDTGEALNLSTRMDDILRWSKTMTDSVIFKTKDDENIDKTEFEKVLVQESSLINEFLSVPDKSILEIRKELNVEDFDDYIDTKEIYMRSSFTTKKYIQKGTIIEKHSILLPIEMDITEDNITKSKFVRDLMNNVSEFGNLDYFISEDNQIMKSWDIIAINDIKPGTELILKNKLPNE